MIKFSENEVYSFKTSGGEEIIAKVISVTDEYLIVKHPLTVMHNQQGMGLVPSLFTANMDENIRLNTNDIFLCGIADIAVKNKFIEATTGISVPNKKLILG